MAINYTVGQRIKINFQNDYHNTHAIGIATIMKIEGAEIFLKIGYSATKQIEKKLCGMNDCSCGSFRGRHVVQATGQQVVIDAPANRDGMPQNEFRPENPMLLLISR